MLHLLTNTHEVPTINPHEIGTVVTGRYGYIITQVKELLATAILILVQEQYLKLYRYYNGGVSDTFTQLMQLRSVQLFLGRVKVVMIGTIVVTIECIQ